MILNSLWVRCSRTARCHFSTVHSFKGNTGNIEVCGKTFLKDEWTNISPKVLSHLGKQLHSCEKHPLGLVTQRIVNHFYKRFVGRTGTPMFSVYNGLDPVVSVEQNFDSLLIPVDHPSRKRSDCYYINHGYLLRGHMTAHQSELIQMGLNNFLVIGDVYRRDEIDSSHYPVFHQLDAVRLCTVHEVFRSLDGADKTYLFETHGSRTTDKQQHHTLEATKLMQHELQTTLAGLARTLFGSVEFRWVEAYFPFTHPSWELEIMHDGNWMEILGCGIMEHKILQKAGAADRIGWAFGLGLERLAMHLYGIPDIRLFWSSDSGFLSQFDVQHCDTPIKYKRVSTCPPCVNDVSFWLPKDDSYSSNDFYDLARSVGGDMVEQVKLVDQFVHPKTGQTSHCYRIVYRHMERSLTQEEVNVVHHQVEQTATQQLGVEIR